MSRGSRASPAISQTSIPMGQYSAGPSFMKRAFYSDFRYMKRKDSKFNKVRRKLVFKDEQGERSPGQRTGMGVVVSGGNQDETTRTSDQGQGQNGIRIPMAKMKDMEKIEEISVIN